MFCRTLSPQYTQSHGISRFYDHLQDEMPRQACLVLSIIYSLSPPGASDLDLSIADICFEISLFFSLFCSAEAPVL
jgi:hypothetical protein